MWRPLTPGGILAMPVKEVRMAERRTERAHVRLTGEESRLIGAAARRAGLGTPDYMRTATVQRARAELPEAEIRRIEGGGP